MRNLLLVLVSLSAPAQTLVPLTNQPPATVGLPFLLTDGSVMVQGPNYFDWYRVSPDPSGSYSNGTWTRLADIPASWNYAPDAFASAVLADGRVVIVGGEYNFNAFTLTNHGAIYDPVTNAWTPIQPPANWPDIGDSPAVVLPDGRFLIGRKTTQDIAALDPATLQWSPLPSTGKSDFNAEEGWTLLPDGSVLTADVKNAPNSERYVASTGRWTTEGFTPVDLHSPTQSNPIPYGANQLYFPPGEIGPAILRPDGTVFFTGASNVFNGHTSIYHPALTSTGAGNWTTGPDFPNDDAGDSSAVLLPSGNVLVVANSGTLYEFDGVHLKPGPVLPAGNTYNMLILPNGQTLITGPTVQVYLSTGTYLPSWVPAIADFPARVLRGATYRITGTQFNGLSQAAAFGDEEETATNYPLVRLTNLASGIVTYARTHDHSSMGVATGLTPVSTYFDIPRQLETGETRLEVIANGIPSPPVTISVECVAHPIDELGRSPIRNRCSGPDLTGPRE